MNFYRMVKFWVCLSGTTFFANEIGRHGIPFYSHNVLKTFLMSKLSELIAQIRQDSQTSLIPSIN